jgi:hypothetical protein
MTIAYVPLGSQDQTLNNGLEGPDALGEKFNWCPVAPTIPHHKPAGFSASPFLSIL